MIELTSSELAQRVAGDLQGPGDLTLTGVEQLDRATARDVSFIRGDGFLAAFRKSEAGVTLAPRQLPLDPPAGRRAIIRVDDADLALNIVLALFAPEEYQPDPGIHPSAVVHPTASIAQGARVGALVTVGPRSAIGEQTVLYERVTIAADCVIGRDVVLHAGVVLRDRTRVGDRVIIHDNAVVGADGFGYRPGPQGPVKVPQIGFVQIEDDVEIGAGTCIDRGKFAETRIGAGTKIDNLCQIAHNVRIGRGCVISGQTGIAGSAVVGDGVVMGGKVGIRDQVRIGDRAVIMAHAAVMNNIPAGETWVGMPAQESHTALKEYAAIRKLPGLVKWSRSLRRGDADRSADASPDKP